MADLERARDAVLAMMDENGDEYGDTIMMRTVLDLYMQGAEIAAGAVLNGNIGICLRYKSVVLQFRNLCRRCPEVGKAPVVPAEAPVAGSAESGPSLADREAESLPAEDDPDPEQVMRRQIGDFAQELLGEDVVAEEGGLESVRSALTESFGSFLTSDYFLNAAAAWGEAPAGSVSRERLISALETGQLAERHIRECLKAAASEYRKARGITMREAEQVAAQEADRNREGHAHALITFLLREAGGQRGLWEVFSARVVFTASESDRGLADLLQSNSPAREAERMERLGDFLRRRYGDTYPAPRVLARVLLAVRPSK